MHRVLIRKDIYTLQGVCKLIHIVGDEEVKLFAGPNRANKNAYEQANGDSDGDGGQTLLCQIEQFVHTVARDCDQAEGEDEYRDTVIKSGFYDRYEPGKGCSCT